MKIGLICGCFDLFHVGHLNILEKAKSNCDHLIVGIVDDAYIQKYKGGSVISENDRRRIVGALRCVDETFIVDESVIKDRLEFCKTHNVSIIFEGDDWKKSDKYKSCIEAGIVVTFFPYTKGISTTKLKKEWINNEYYK